MRTLSIFFITFLLLLSTYVNAQRIEKVKFEPYGNDILISYKVESLSFNQKLTTSLYVSTDGGINFQGPLKMVSGEIGPGILNGFHKIIWEATKEIPLDKAEIVFDVRAEVNEDQVKKDFFVVLSGNQITPLGFRVGLLGKTGYYLSLQSNLTPGFKGSYTYKDNFITDYNRFAWYEFTTEHKKAAYIACAGLTFQAARNLFFYTGAGYGKYEVLYEIKEYSYDDNSLLDTSYGKDTDISATGVALEAGLIFRTGKLLIMGGGNIINFKQPSWMAGIGISF